ncbi:unnamed protein product [Didymodactylos carnosus]|uniref:DUF4537 domain-containing protein n=1 Tax=Didymodactylos carnosus TaxID=1234261 RepID=A0A814A039_9BILA|nr:unnamed protein product [Didymodactylos carnosus]CAF1054386.1 unnamed protein product [Didymodactylos carnosus]CAF3686927.1 unnamed protein product [Didymodactylos carnosus]CAF3820785.1 unnamed protein product [Didymodactylos carnosus]
MYVCLSTIKEHIIAYLRVHVSDSATNLMLNFIEFHSDIRQWADRMVSWNKNSILIAEEWIRSLAAKTSTNTLTALLAAFSEPMCEQIILITDGIPDQEPYFILCTLKTLDNLKPCHVFYVSTPNSQNTSEEETIVKFLTDLAKITCGSLTIVNFSQTGSLKSLVPVVTYYPSLVDSLYMNNPNVMFSSEIHNGQLIDDSVIQLSPPPTILWSNTDVPLTDKHYEIAHSPEVGSLLIGQEVLARKATDGYYYRGKILNQLSAYRFMVEFDPKTSGIYREPNFQDTTLYDIIHYRDALMHAIKRGDYVLGPIGDNQGRYMPGEVLDGFEKRLSCENGEEKSLVIYFTDGKTVKMKRSNDTIWISSSLYERIKFELSIPPNARQLSEIHSVSYPSKLLSNYPVQPSIIPLATNNLPLFVPSIKSYSTSLAPKRIIPKDELNQRVDLQIEKHRLLLNENQQESKTTFSSASDISFNTRHPNCCFHSHCPSKHFHSYSTSLACCCTSTTPSPACCCTSTTTAKSSRSKSVCFGEHSVNGRKYSVDDAHFCSQSPSIKSYPKSLNSSTNFVDGTEQHGCQIPLINLVKNSPTHTSSISKQHFNNNEPKRSSYEFYETKTPITTESKTIKSAPESFSHSHHTHMATQRSNMGHMNERTQRDIRDELQKQQIEREEFKKHQANDEHRLIVNHQQQQTDKAEQILNTKRYPEHQVISNGYQRAQYGGQDHLWYKQSQYEQRNFDSHQRQAAKEPKDAELLHHRQTNDISRNKAYHNSVLASDFDRLYKNVLNRKFHNNYVRKTGVLRDREQKRNDFIKDVGKKHMTWTNATILT